MLSFIFLWLRKNWIWIMVFGLNLIAVKLVLEEALVDVLRYHVSCCTWLSPLLYSAKTECRYEYGNWKKKKRFLFINKKYWLFFYQMQHKFLLSLTKVLSFWRSTKFQVWVLIVQCNICHQQGSNLTFFSTRKK
jgi:hypothetical protein